MIEGAMYYNTTNFFTICRRTYRMHHQCYGSKNFSNTTILLKVDRFEGFSNQTNVDELVINSTSGYNYKNYKLINKNYKLNNSLVLSYSKNFLI